MRRFPGARPLAILFVLALFMALRPAGAGQAAVRHHFYVGTITSLSAGSVTIHSKTHKANFTFTIDKGTKFLRLGQGIPRKQFKVGSYVTVSYSPGAHHTMIAWHISLRNHPKARK